MNPSQKKYLITWSFGLVLFTLVAFGFSNCSRAILGPNVQDAAQSNSTQSINVGSATCPAGQVAIGLDTSANAICASTQTVTGGLTCPTDFSVYQVDTSGNDVVCVSNHSWDTTGSVCPVGEYLTAYSSSGAIQCSSPTNPIGGGTTISLSCPSGQYASAVVNGQVVCSQLPATTPSAIVCPANQYLYDITGSTPDCRTPAWTGGVQQACPNGSFALGWNGTNLLCQQNSFSVGQTTACPAGQILLSYTSGGTATCAAPPNPDISHACPSGSNVNGVNNGKIVCQTATAGAGPQCPVGQFVVGLNNGQAICQSVAVNHLPGVCPTSSYPIGVSNGAVVCSGFSQVLSISSGGQVCSPNSSQVCAISGGLGLQTCDSAGATLSACLAVSCSSGYQLSNGQCNAVACIAGSSQTCQMANGSGTQYCGAMGTWGSCQVQSCNPGYVMSAGSCVQALCSPGSIAACSVGNAYGFQSCNISGNGYGSCVITSCQNGYSLQNQTCVDTSAPRISFTAQPLSPTSGNMANITFSAIDNESGVDSVTCLLDNAPYNPCTSPVALKNLANGGHLFSVTAIDKTGNKASRSIQWVNNVCEAGPSKQCSFGNGTGLMYCQADGTYSPNCTLNSCSSGYTLSNGSCVALTCNPGYTVSGNACVDNTPPVLTLGQKPTDPTIGTTASVQFAAADQGSGVSGYQCTLDTMAAQSCASPLNLSGLSTGSHTLTITASDASGNKASQTISWHEFACSPGQVSSCGISNGSGSETCSATGSGYGSCVATACNNGYTMSNGQCLDMSAPSLAIQSGPSGATQNTTASVSFSATDAGSGIGSITCALDSGAAQACSSPATYTGLRAGAHSLTIAATDRSGNVAKQVLTWTVQACTPNSKSACSLANGSGQMTCSADGLSVSSCSAVSCNAGYVASGGQCVGIPQVGIYRWFNTVTGEHFYSTIFAEGSAIPWNKYEGVGFNLYATQGAGMHPIYRCYMYTYYGNLISGGIYATAGWHYLSTAKNCEGWPNVVNQMTIGYAYDNSDSNLLPLQRYYSGLPCGNGDHLITIHPESEYIAQGHYYLEGTIGYVPKQ